MNKILFYFFIKYAGNWQAIYNALDKKEKVDDLELNKLILNNNSSFLSIVDSQYPDFFKSMNMPPFVLIYKGDIELLNNKYAYLIFKINSNQKNILKEIFEENEGICTDYKSWILNKKTIMNELDDHKKIILVCEDESDFEEANLEIRAYNQLIIYIGTYNAPYKRISSVIASALIARKRFCLKRIDALSDLEKYLIKQLENNGINIDFIDK